MLDVCEGMCINCCKRLTGDVTGSHTLKIPVLGGPLIKSKDYMFRRVS